MTTELRSARDHFIQGTSRIAHFWGFPKAMGAIYGAVYLSPRPVTLDDLVELVGISKGAVSTNVRMLERLQMVHKRVKVGDRKDYYEAETDFWKTVRGVLREREHNEFDRALRAVGESLGMAESAKTARDEAELKAFYVKRIATIKSFFGLLDGVVGAILTLDDLRSSALQRTFGKIAGKRSGH